jgi:hypothetical protein
MGIERDSHEVVRGEVAQVGTAGRHQQGIAIELGAEVAGIAPGEGVVQHIAAGGLKLAAEFFRLGICHGLRM